MNMRFVSGIIAGSIIGITAAAAVMITVPQFQGEATRALIRNGKNFIKRNQENMNA